jgi:uncharacterized membrane protein HdeD (DUF308 family)
MLNLVLVVCLFILIMFVAFQNNPVKWQRTFCNDNGSPSSNRVFLALVLVFLLHWATQIMERKSAIPDIPDGWLWLIGIFSGIVAVTKFSKALETKFTGTSDTTQPTG